MYDDVKDMGSFHSGHPKETATTVILSMSVSSIYTPPLIVPALIVPVLIHQAGPESLIQDSMDLSLDHTSHEHFHPSSPKTWQSSN